MCTLYIALGLLTLSAGHAWRPIIYFASAVAALVIFAAFASLPKNLRPRKAEKDNVYANEGCRHRAVTDISHLETTVDFDDTHNRNRSNQMCISARLHAVVADGRRVLLLGDRGWASSGPHDIWARISVEDTVDMAKMVVGPDEPEDGLSYEDEEAAYWASLAGVLRQQGFSVDAAELQRLPHNILLSHRLRMRLGRQADGDTDDG